ncbi:RuBisCO large subunit C-terminal-like domain-containing protein [Caldinitratiruptor microaerophilus]|uniref:Ribulose-bisphosphate carboxylase n=1 Tax=Caldinitratiruptor microaerophilus TaxID=671077 RepID=A0AA35CJK4_9FIRM|nr:RuBisCO large subunit C-terminal-like domain-containing protein [Caldinitratiruptor microaerophilus]BDG59533.1 ribulose-bisphosphate carboxylase [Caldinitratiruptor microaerophilus]
MPAKSSLNLSGNRFAVAYRLSDSLEAAWARAQDICFEQTVEFPEELLPAGEIRDHLVGRVEALEELEPGQVEVVVSYAVEIVGADLTQLLNVVFGNISLKPGVRLERLELPESLLQRYRGPRFGREGLRDWLGASGRPLLATALKPVGLTSHELAEQAYQFALGGIDIIKDDHGLTDQPFAPFRERVERCAEAVRRANRETGGRSIYVANVTAPGEEALERALLAKAAGAGGLLVCPGLTGFDTMRRLAEDDRIALPVMSHPAFLGSWVTSPTSGISHHALFGQIMRLAGADAVIYPNWGGRFSFSRDECRQIAEGCEAPMGHLKPAFPTPAGGMTPERIPEMSVFYGQDAIFLIGGGLHRDGPDLAQNSRRLVDLLLQYR